MQPTSNGFKPAVGPPSSPHHQFPTYDEGANNQETRLPVSNTTSPNSGYDLTSYEPRRTGWAFKDVDWCFVFAAQHWATFVWAIIFLICLGIVHWVQHVTTRPFLQYDASISYIAHKDTVGPNVAWIIPFLVLLLNLVVLEFFVLRRQNKSVSHALALTLYFFIDAICCFICMRFIVEVTKLSAGRLRPDFLQDCYGIKGLSGTPNLSFANGSSAECTKKNADSRKSLPSGHSSSSMVTIAYSIIYCLWTAYFRSSTSSFANLNIRTGFRGNMLSRFWKDFAHTTFLVWLVAQFCFTWATGITRFTDNKHNVSDIVAGWFIGLCIALIFTARAIGMSKFIFLSAV